MSYSAIILERSGGVATITLNRPQVLNAQTPESLAELNAALEEIEQDESVGVAILKGAGRAFCTGMDLKTSFGPEGAARTKQRGGHGIRFPAVCRTMESMSKPLIAAVHGYAVTGGFLLAYAADLLIAADNAQFMDTHARYGLILGAGESQRMPRRIGLANAKELLFLCDPIDAAQAQRIGLANRVVPLAKLDATAREFADKILRNSRKSIGVIKSLVNNGARADFETGMKLESDAMKGFTANLEPNPDRDARLRAFAERK